jgi:hypothetical protein
MEMCLVLHLPRNASWQTLFTCPAPIIVFESAAKPTHLAHFWQGAESIAPATSNDDSPSKSGPNVVCF